MSTSNAGPGGVRNLRAMFENKAGDQSNSPPSRGRSPNESGSTTEERPLSKVRASFVAVDKAEEEVPPTATARRASNITMDGTNDNPTTNGESLGQILKGSPFVDDGQFQDIAPQGPSPNGVGDRAAAMVRRMQEGHTEAPPKGSVVDSSAGPKATRIGRPGLPMVEPDNSQSQAGEAPAESPTKPKGPIVKPKGGGPKILGIMKSAAEAQAKNDAAAAKEAPEAEYEADATTPQDIPDSSNKADKGTPTLAGGARLKGGGPKIHGIQESANRAKEARATAAADSASKNYTSKEATKPTMAIKTARTSLPTRKLPSATVAPPVPSVVRKDDPKAVEAKSVEKKAMKVPPRVANSTTASSLAKKSSRASLNAGDSTKSRAPTRPADESFLARMTRPTASTAQKAHEKVQVQSPPRPRQGTGKTLSTRASRMSLSQTSDDKENEADVPVVPAIPQRAEDKIESL